MLLAANLLAAIMTNRTFRTQTALLSFHVGLLAVVLLAALGTLTHLHGRVELVEGERLTADVIEIVSRGLLHSNQLRDLHVEQGPVKVEYLRGLARGDTRSELRWRDRQGRTRSGRFGDRRSLSVDGYRFQPTFNKGFSLLLDWRDSDGSRQLGTINFPSYPEFEWKQQNTWMTPAGEVLTLELVLPERIPEGRAWVLNSGRRDFKLRVTAATGGQRTLEPGDAIELRDGTFGLVGLRLWIGYRIDANPFLPWILAAALFSIVAMALHFLQRHRVTVSRAAVSAPARESTA